MSGLPRKSYRSDLSDVQWRRVKGLLPKSAHIGRPRVNDREVINGILYVLSTGCRWEDLPHDIDVSCQTCNRRLLEYQRRRVWQKILRELMKEANRRHKLNLTNCYHDASAIKSKRGRKIKSVTRENTIF
jgi:putative transposase